MSSRSYKAEVQVIHDTNWYTNQVRFKTKAEAEIYAKDLWSRWTASKAWRVKGCNDPVNYMIVDGKLTPKESPDEAPDLPDA